MTKTLFRSILSDVLHSKLSSVRDSIDSHNYNCNERDDDLRTGLHLAVQSSSLDILNLLISHNFYLGAGPSINSLDTESFSPLHLACSQGDAFISHVSLLLNHNADLHILTKKRYTPLFLAVESGSLNIVSLLLDRGSYVTLTTQKTNRFKSALHIAAKYNQRGVLDVLLKHGGIERNIREPKYGGTCLHVAVMSNHLDCLRLMIDRGVSLFKLTDYSWSVLHLAVEYGLCEIIDYFLSLPNDVIKKLVNIKTRTNRSVLHTAIKARCRNENFDRFLNLFEQMIDLSDVNLQDRQGLTPLHLAVGSGQLKFVKLLLKKVPELILSNTNFHTTSFTFVYWFSLVMSKLAISVRLYGF
ncbi:hypothetical protein GEMRC1_011103 [Eukaryota sp. GEM-RC1]